MCYVGDRGPLHSITMAAPARPGCCYVSFPSSSGNIKGKYTKGGKGDIFGLLSNAIFSYSNMFHRQL